MKHIIFIFTVLLAFSSCSKLDFTTEDPNNFADASAVLVAKAPFLANALVIEGDLARNACIWAGHFTGADRQYISLNNYSTTAGDYDNIWGTLYADGIAQARLMQKKAINENNAVLEGIGMIVEANLGIQAAALWGDVPFSEAGDVGTFPQPKYDAQVDVYNNILSLLDVAITKVGTSAGDFGAYVSETLGEATRSTMLWSEVAHSLKARIYLHLGNYANAITEANLGISSEAGDWFFEHPGGSYPNNISTAHNVYFDFCAWNRDGYMGAGDAYLVPLMEGRNDERLYYYYFAPGDWNNDWYPYAWTGGIFDAPEDFPVITYYETQLILAEAELVQNGNATNALAALNNVRAYWDNRMGTGFPAYLPSDFATNADLLEEVLTEKYISCYGQIEAFNDMRRTDNYIGIPLKAGAPVQAIPERFVYPQNELNSNSNVPAIQDIYVPTQVNNGNYPGAK
jgi:hypothetical protein